MRTPFPTEKRERNLAMVRGFAAGMSNKELVIEHKLNPSRVADLIRSTCKTVNEPEFNRLCRETGASLCLHYRLEKKLSMKVLRANKHLFSEDKWTQPKVKVEFTRGSARVELDDGHIVLRLRIPGRKTKEEANLQVAEKLNQIIGAQ